MNTNFNDTPLDDSRFDRLVDGELDEQQRRELLSGLDDVPGGWRRCALAFLESQCWKQSFGIIPRSAAKTPPASDQSVLRSQVHPPRWHSHLGTLMAMAASFLIMFYVGSLLLKTHHEQPVASVGIPSEVATTVNSPNPWRMVTVAAPAGSPVRVPAVERENIDPQWLKNMPPAIPDDVRQAFNRTGHQVEQQRELVPVPLQDGRQLVVPVDQVKVHYVGDGPY
jgi:hypothetical protein